MLCASSVASIFGDLGLWGQGIKLNMSCMAHVAILHCSFREQRLHMFMQRCASTLAASSQLAGFSGSPRDLPSLETCTILPCPKRLSQNCEARISPKLGAKTKARRS